VKLSLRPAFDCGHFESSISGRHASANPVVTSDGAVLIGARLWPAAEPVRAHAARHTRTRGRSVALVRDGRAVFSAASRDTARFAHADSPTRTAARRTDAIERASVKGRASIRVRAHLHRICGGICARAASACATRTPVATTAARVRRRISWKGSATASSCGDHHHDQVHPAANQSVHVTRKRRSRR
jgi:hypothetical protein